MERRKRGRKRDSLAIVFMIVVKSSPVSSCEKKKIRRKGRKGERGRKERKEGKRANNCCVSVNQIPQLDGERKIFSFFSI